MQSNNFKQVVFAGGGNRCFWQAGFWHTIAKPLALQPQQIAAVSAGSAIACMLFANKTEETLRYFKSVTANNKRNYYWHHILHKESIFPHAKIYREAITTVINQNSLQQLHKGPEIKIQLSQIPRWLGPKSGAIVGLLAYKIEKQIYKPVHPTYGQKVGFTPVYKTVRECHTPTQLADLILASSCTPPFTPISYFNQKPVLDGGIIDNVPVNAIDTNHGKTLILLTRQYQNLKQSNLRHYVQPSKPVPINSWDYTNPKGVQAAFDLGRYDGDEFLTAMMSQTTPE